MNTNKLINENSPYLLQHAHNPVDWYPWGDEAFQKAKEENKPIFVSIGYSTCYWCHVMEREVFENNEIAGLLNKSYINIKVDREERPDIDRVYMAALQSMTGSGGWPLNMFLTPDLKPFYGATYIPPKAKYGRAGIEDIIMQVNKLWSTKRDEVIESSNKITEFLSEKTRNKTGITFDEDSVSELQEKVFEQSNNSFDYEYGGFGQGNKFPRPVLLDFLLKFYKNTGEVEALDIVTFTLKKMYEGGIYDHLGGGFHRYSVDSYWRVPHFEKMLYDQAQLTEIYLDTYLITGKTLFLNIAKDIMDYVLRNLTDKNGGFYSAEDAESYPDKSAKSIKQEGAFYLWEKNEIAEFLTPDEAVIFNSYFGIEPFGNTIEDPHNVFGNKNVLYIAKNPDDISKASGKSTEGLIDIIGTARGKLFKEREKRPKPHQDDKILTSWNGMMISAFSKAYKCTSDNKYLKAAKRCTDFILQKLYGKENKNLFHRYRNNEVKYEGTLEDYAFLINGLINLYEACFDAKYLSVVIELNEIAINKFFDKENGGFFDTTVNKKDIIFNIKENYDGAEPSGNSVNILNLIKIGTITQNTKLMEYAQKSLEIFLNDISKLPFSSPAMINNYHYYINSFGEFIISGNKDEKGIQDFINIINKYYMPDKIVLFADSHTKKLSGFIDDLTSKEKKNAVYICENFKCNLPIYDTENLKYFLEQKNNKGNII